MCTLAVFLGVSRRFPLVVAANRDEFLGRPATAPATWHDEPSLVAGRDLVAGGTWLGCRTDGSGRVAAVLNRRLPSGPVAEPTGLRSRGLLCLDALRATVPEEFLDGLEHGDGLSAYAGVNLFLAGPGGAWVVDNAAGTRVRRLVPGLSLLTNLDLDDERCPRLAGTAPRLRARLPVVAEALDDETVAAALFPVMGSHEAGVEGGADASPLSRTCIHAGGYGTRSSSVIVVAADGAVSFFHADGPPCTAELRRVATA